MNTWIEVIRPIEKVYGYEPPAKFPATPKQLLRSISEATGQMLPVLVWKVRRLSDQYPRQLKLDGKRLKCKTIGSVTGWWFVSVDCEAAKRALFEPGSVL